MTVNRAFAIISFLCITATSGSAEPVLRHSVIAPVVQLVPQEGAHGSLWVTQLFAHNAGKANVWIYPVPTTLCPTGPPCSHVLVEPGKTVELRLGGQPGPEQRYFMFAEENADVQVAFNLRVQDLSRQALTYGTELPVVSMDDEFDKEFVLPVVPLDERFRQALRIYPLRPNEYHSVDVMIWDRDGGTLLVQERVSGFGTLQILDLAARYPELDGTDAVGIRVISVLDLTPERPIWGFVSITHDETQHVTTITPQP